MKWYDYIYCLIFADLISAGLVLGNIVYLMSGIIMYLIYEKLAILMKDNE